MHDETFEEYKARMQCTCPITAGMTFFQLRALGSGCTRVGVCPVLTRRRAMVRQPSREERAADDLALARLLRIGKGVGV